MIIGDKIPITKQIKGYVMKGYAWISKVSEYSHLNTSKLAKEQKQLHEMLVHKSKSQNPNYSNINKDFLKLLKNQQDKEHIRIVLSWLDHGIFSDGWGLLSNGLFHGEPLSALNAEDKKTITLLLKTLKSAFYEHNFQPNYISLKDKAWSVETLLNKLEIGNSKKPIVSKLKIAADKLQEGVKLPRRLKKTVQKVMEGRGSR